MERCFVPKTLWVDGLSVKPGSLEKSLLNVPVHPREGELSLQLARV